MDTFYKFEVVMFVLLISVFLLCSIGYIRKSIIIKDFFGQDSLKLDINSASLQELELLPYVGRSKAKNIIVYRERNKLFHSLKDLLDVKGIGEKTMLKIKAYIKVSKDKDIYQK